MKDLDIILLQNFLNDKSLKIYRDSENNIIVDGDIYISTTDINSMPVKIHILNGSLDWHGEGLNNNGSLSTLINFPDIINGTLNIYNNPYLRSLKGCPSKITGSLNCNNCMISDISDIAKEIGGTLNISNNPISDISILEKININKVYALNTYWAYNNKRTDNASIIFETYEIDNGSF